jgi:septal ring factor EnvC (AmiA/AmiB activator)
MRRGMALALIPLTFAGCLTPFTSRIDEANRHAAQLNEQMAVANAKLVDATDCLLRSEKKLDEATATLHNMERRLDDMDKRSEVIEKGFRKLMGIKGPEEE